MGIIWKERSLDYYAHVAYTLVLVWLMECLCRDRTKRIIISITISIMQIQLKYAVINDALHVYIYMQAAHDSSGFIKPNS